MENNKTILDFLTDKYFIKAAMDFIKDEDEKRYWIENGISKKKIENFLLSVSLFMANDIRKRIEKLLKN